MKKLIFIGLLIFFVSGVQAQETRFGVKGGTNFANIFGDDYGADTRISIHFGLLTELGISKRFSIQPEILYSGQGSKSDYLTWKLDYLTVPILAKYFIAEGFSLEAGPYMAYNLLSEWKVETDSFDMKEETARIDMGAGFGLEYELLTGVFFQVRYQLGMITIWDYIHDSYYMNEMEFDADAKDPQTKNIVFQLSVGYKF